jgi:hypothetical protein
MAHRYGCRPSDLAASDPADFAVDYAAFEAGRLSREPLKRKAGKSGGGFVRLDEV